MQENRFQLIPAAESVELILQPMNRHHYPAGNPPGQQQRDQDHRRLDPHNNQGQPIEAAVQALFRPYSHGTQTAPQNILHAGDVLDRKNRRLAAVGLLMIPKALALQRIIVKQRGSHPAFIRTSENLPAPVEHQRLPVLRHRPFYCAVQRRLRNIDKQVPHPL